MAKTACLAALVHPLLAQQSWHCKVTEDLGCYDHHNHSHFLPTPVSGGDNMMSRTYCASIAKDSGFGSTAFCGVEYGNQCWCAQALSPDAKKIDDSKCDMPCAGDSMENCGGSYAVGVFRAVCDVGPPSPPPTPPPTPPPPPPTPPPSPSDIKVTSVLPPSGSIPRYSVAEWHLVIVGITGDFSVWESVNVSMQINVPSSDETLTVAGFYYGDGNDWRLRFAPSVVGNYAYTLTVTRFGAQLHSSTGTLQCSASNAKGWLRPQYDSFPYRTIYEGDGTLFTGSGIGDCLNDQLTFETLNETLNPGTWKEHTYTRSLEEYASDYSDFSIFRFSNANCMYNLYESLDDGEHKEKPAQRLQGNSYNAALLQVTDRFFDTMRAHGFSFWFVPFEVQGKSKLPPLDKAGEHWTIWHEAQREALARYLDLVVARWGAQVDTWSLTNEARASENWIHWTAEYIRSIDPYKHPISVSWNRPDLDDIDVNSIHWYHSDDIRQEDVDTCDIVDQSLSAQKPVYITETGNLYHNWDADSHVRMRMRTYTTLFKGATVVWWNTAGTKQCKPCGGGNMFLGVTERQHQKVYVNFAKKMTDPAAVMFNLTNSEGIRSYGLRGSNSNGGQIMLVYVHHFADHSTSTIADLVLPAGLPSLTECHGEWVFPENGTTVKASPVNATTLATPPFQIDIALSLECAGSVLV